MNPSSILLAKDSNNLECWQCFAFLVETNWKWQIPIHERDRAEVGSRANGLQSPSLLAALYHWVPTLLSKFIQANLFKLCPHESSHDSCSVIFFVCHAFLHIKSALLPRSELAKTHLLTLRMSPGSSLWPSLGFISVSFQNLCTMFLPCFMAFFLCCLEVYTMGHFTLKAVTWCPWKECAFHL